MIPQLSTASVGSHITRSGVTFFPVYVHQSPPDILTGSTAQVQVSELPGARVPSLAVRNPHDVPVLITEGETLNGGWQNRVVNLSVLVPAAGAVEIPVSCVEAGRWGGERDFGRRGPKAPRRVRRGATVSVTNNLRTQNNRHSDQGLVWSMIDHELDANQIVSETRAIDELSQREFQDKHIGAAITELCERGPLPGQAGVVVAHGRRIVAAEVYASPAMLAASWEAVVRGYLLEARGEPNGTPSATKALRFLNKVASRVVSSQPGLGLGEELRISASSIAGQALLHEGSLIHVSAFALAA